MFISIKNQRILFFFLAIAQKKEKYTMRPNLFSLHPGSSKSPSGSNCTLAMLFRTRVRAAARYTQAPSGSCRASRASFGC